MTRTATALRRRSLQQFMRLDHERLQATFRALLDALETGDAVTLRGAWARFDVGLTNHMLAEERHALPEFRLEHPEEAAALERDHDRVRAALLEMGVGIDLHVVSLDRVARLVRDLEAHAEHEGALFHAWVDEALSESARRRMGAVAGVEHQAA